MKTTKDTSRFDYLRNRPFLAIEVLFGPEKGVHTERKGWSKERENIKLFDRPEIVYRISDKIMCRSVVIFDIMKNKLVKNRLRLASPDVDPLEFDQQIIQSITNKYADMITQARLFGGTG